MPCRNSPKLAITRRDQTRLGKPRHLPRELRETERLDDVPPVEASESRAEPTNADELPGVLEIFLRLLAPLLCDKQRIENYD